MSYLVDTSWAVEFLRNNREVHQRLHQMENEGLAVSVITVAELYRGVFLARDPDRGERGLLDFLAGVSVLGIDHEISRMFGREDARLRQNGNSVGHMDLLIAVTALRHNFTLLTSDRDFERVEGLQTIYL